MDLSDLTFKTAFNGLQHLKALAPLPCPQPLQPTCEIVFMSFHQLVYSIVFYYCLALPVSELKPHLAELLQSVKRWAFSGSGPAADVSPLYPDMEENWTKGGLNIAFHRAEINVSVHSCISTKSHRNKLKMWTN